MKSTSEPLNTSFLPQTVVWGILFITGIPIVLNFFGVNFEAEATSVYGPTGEVASSLVSLKGVLVHTILEWSAFMLALVTCGLAFTNYSIQRDPGAPVLGIALLCAGFLDGFHTLAADRLIEASAPNENLIPFTWALCRLFNALICLLGISLVLVQKNYTGRQKASFLITVSLGFLLMAYGSIYWATSTGNLPQTLYPDSLVTRPWDIYPLVLFCISAGAYWVYFRRRPTPFAHAMLLSTIPAIATQLHMAFGSTVLFDNHFNIAHFLKILSYAVPYLGLSWGYITTNKEKEVLNRELLDLQVALDSSALVTATDYRGKINFVNESFLKISKYDESEILGKDHRLLNSGHHDKAFFKEMWDTIKRGEVWSGEIKNRAKDGSHYWVQSTICPRFDTRKNLIGFISIRFETTQKKQQELDIIKSRDMALAAERAKSAFLANMSHEIRTPMNGILGMIQLLSDTKLNSEQKGLVATARSCGDGLLTILNDILDLSKIESGKLELELVDFDLNKCIKDAIFLSQKNAEKKGIELRFEPIPGRAWYRGDVTRIRQILVNLISNSVKFTEYGFVEVIVHLAQKPQGYHQIQISVKDSGIGISEEGLSKLFQEFSQADSSTTRRFGGTGLGLSICQKLVTLMGGQIFVQSTEGKGSTFGFTIDMEMVRPEDDSEVQEVFLENTVDESFSMSHIFYHKILVAEDNSVNQRLVKMMFKNLGYQCDLVSNGLEAIEQVTAVHAQSDTPYTIIFMDMQMPEMDGLEATKKIIEQFGKKTPPIVAMTANAFPEDRQRCFDAGMSDFVAKPIKIEDLRRVLGSFSKPVRPRTIDIIEPKGITMDYMVDFKSLNEMFLGDEEILVEMVEDFSEQVPGHLEKLESAFAQGDWKQLEITAHTLKGIAGSFCSEVTREQAFKVESGAREFNLEYGEVQNLMDQVKNLLSTLEDNYTKQAA